MAPLPRVPARTGPTPLRVSQNERFAINAVAVFAALLVSATSSCSPERYARDADRDVSRVLERQTEDVLGKREAEALRPEPAADAEPPEPPT